MSVDFDLLLDTYLEVDIALKDKLLEHGYEEVTSFIAEAHPRPMTAIRVYLLDATLVYSRNPITADEATIDMFIVIKNNEEATISLYNQLKAYKTI